MLALYHVSSGCETRLLPQHPNPGEDANSVLGTFWSACPLEAIENYAAYPLEYNFEQPVGTIFRLDVDEDVHQDMEILSGFDALFAEHIEDPEARRCHFATLRALLLHEGKKGVIFDTGETP